MKNCTHCGVLFKPTRNAQQFCCTECFVVFCQSIAKRKKADHG
jgi:protein-arginine kinase activator protein McsA